MDNSANRYLFFNRRRFTLRTRDRDFRTWIAFQAVTIRHRDQVSLDLALWRRSLAEFILWNLGNLIHPEKLLFINRIVGGIRFSRLFPGQNRLSVRDTAGRPRW